MTWTAYYTPLDLVINLSEPDLGHPEYPDLWDRLYTASLARGELVCMGTCAHGDNLGCAKTPDGAMFLRQQGSRRQAVHYPTDVQRNTWTIEETDTHKALKERIATAAERHGFPAAIEITSGNRRRRADVTITGANGRVLRAEAQVSNIDVGTVVRRDRIDRAEGATPLWVTREVPVGGRNAAPLWVDRSPWTLIRPMPWQEIASSVDIPVRGGVKKLVFERCGQRTPLCPKPSPGRTDRKPCQREHAYFDPAHGVVLDELIGQMAAETLVDIRIPRSRRSSFYNIVSAADAAEWAAYRTADGEADLGADDQDVEFAEREPNGSCDPRDWDTQARATGRADPAAWQFSGVSRHPAATATCRYEAVFGPHQPGGLRTCSMCPGSPTYWRDHLDPVERARFARPLQDIYAAA